MARTLNRKTLGLNGIEFFEDVDLDWKPEAHIAMLQEALLDFVKVIPRLGPQFFGVRAEAPEMSIHGTHRYNFRNTLIFPRTQCYQKLITFLKKGWTLQR